ncbi:hypothetical protein FDECE_11199, partial [Fusarium decemcellulare]
MVVAGVQEDLLQIESSAVYSRHAFQSGTNMDLRKILHELPLETRYLHVYCVNLDYSTKPGTTCVSIELAERSQLRYIYIFTCAFLNHPEIQSFQISGPKLRKFKIYYEIVPANLAWNGQNNKPCIIARDDPNFNINITDSEELHRSTQNTFKAEIQAQIDAAKHLALNKNMVGICITVDRQNSRLEPIHRIPSGEFQPIKLPTASDVTSATSSTRPPFNGLVFLLNHLFSRACVFIFHGLGTLDKLEKETAEQTAMKYLAYICRCTSYCPEYSALREDAATLLNRLELARRYPSQQAPEAIVGKYFVPPASHLTYKKSLDDAMAMCKDVEASVSNLKLVRLVTDQIRKDNATTLRALSQLGLGTISNAKTYETMDVSSKLVFRRRKEMTDRKDNLLQAEKNFKKGFEQYQEDKKKERDMAMLAGAGEIAVKLVIALCTNPAEAIPTIVDISAVVKEAVQQATQAESGTKRAPLSKSKASHVLDEVAPTALSAGSKMVEAWQSYENNMTLKSKAEECRQKAINYKIEEAASAAGLAITSSSPRIDFFGLMANWQEIKASVSEMFAVLKFKLGTETIAGLEEYRTALSNMIIRGQALIEAQRQFQDDMGAYFRGVAENALRKKRVDEIGAVANEIESRDVPLQDHVDNLKASTFVLKRTAVLHLHRYLLSLKYRSSRYNYIGVNASPEMPVEQLQHALKYIASELELRSDDGQNEQKAPTVELATDDKEENVFPPEWKEWLVRLKKIPFTIPYNYSEVKRFYDIRTRDISAQFFRQDGSAFQKVKYEVSLGPVFIDRDAEGQLHQYYAREFNIVKTDTEGEWISASQTESDAKILPALFSSGVIDFGYIKLKNIDLDDVARVKLTAT